MKRREHEKDSSRTMLEPIPLDLKKMSRLPVKFGMKAHQKKLFCGVEPRLWLESNQPDRNEDDESDKRPCKLDPIPFDLEVDILTRLPVKAVMRSRCVSKMWSFIIRSQGFIDAYYAMSSATRSRFIVTFSNSIFVRGDAKRLFIFSGEESSSSSSSSLVANLDMTIPSMCFDGFTKCSSVHGFVACFNGSSQLTIYNPSTGQVVTLPRGSKGYPISWGYDPVDVQFKALTLVSTPDHGYDCFTVLEVMRLGGRGGESRNELISSPPHSPLTQGICINGFLYYGAFSPGPDTNPVIVCFDVRYDKIRFITTPNDVLSMLSLSVLIEYKGKLASIVRRPHPFNFRTFDLWILEDEKKHDWSKQTFELPYTLVAMTSPGTNEAGEIIFAPTKLSHDVQPFFYFFYYNLERKDMRKVRIHGIADDQGFRRRYGLNGDCHVSVSLQHAESIASL